MLIKYGCVTLRAIEENDWELLLSMMNSPEIDMYVGNAHLPASELSQKNWISQYKNTDETIRLMIELNNGKTIGMIMLQHIDYRNQIAELGIKTYVSDVQDRLPHDTDDAYNAMLKFAFDELNMNCIYCFVTDDNMRSLKFHNRLGFKEDGVLRHRLYSSGIHKNLVAFSMLKDEFENK